MAMLSLPAPRRAHLRAFWLVQSAYIAVLVTIIARVVGLRLNILLGIFIWLLVALFGFAWPQAIARLYRAWARWAENYGCWAKKWLLRICYHLVLTPAGCAGSAISRERRESMWVPRSTLSPLTYSSPHDLPFPGCSRSWIAAYYPGWTYKSGYLWALGLLPFILLISALDEKSTDRYSGHIYTLF
jgi:hypothetical protein